MGACRVHPKKQVWSTPWCVTPGNLCAFWKFWWCTPQVAIIQRLSFGVTSEKGLELQNFVGVCFGLTYKALFLLQRMCMRAARSLCKVELKAHLNFPRTLWQSILLVFEVFWFRRTTSLRIKYFFYFLLMLLVKLLAPSFSLVQTWPAWVFEEMNQWMRGLSVCLPYSPSLNIRNDNYLKTIIMKMPCLSKNVRWMICGGSMLCIFMYETYIHPTAIGVMVSLGNVGDNQEKIKSNWLSDSMMKNVKHHLRG